MFSHITVSEYGAARQWVRSIETQAVPVCEDWLSKYKEASPARGGGRKKSAIKHSATPLVSLKLPKPKGAKDIIKDRRGQLAAFKKKQNGLIRLFRQCAGKQSSAQFYENLPKYWSYKSGDRLTGVGWERLGKDSDFQELSRSYLRILGAKDEDRDDIVVEEIDTLQQKNVVTRNAFLSEMLCLQFPEAYPVVSKPVQDYLKFVSFKAPRGSSEGSRYIDLARKLRFSLIQNPDHPARTLAELDAVVWLVFGKK